MRKAGKSVPATPNIFPKTENENLNVYTESNIHKSGNVVRKHTKVIKLNYGCGFLI